LEGLAILLYRYLHLFYSRIALVLVVLTSLLLILQPLQLFLY